MKNEFQIIIKETNKIYKINDFYAIFSKYKDALNKVNEIKKFFNKDIFIRWITYEDKNKIKIIDLDPSKRVTFNNYSSQILNYSDAIIKEDEIKIEKDEIKNINEDEIKNININLNEVEKNWKIIENIYKIEIDKAIDLQPSKNDNQTEDIFSIKYFEDIFKDDSKFDNILKILKFINFELINIQKSEFNFNINFIFEKKKEYLILICKLLISEINNTNVLYKRINFKNY